MTDIRIVPAVIPESREDLAIALAQVVGVSSVAHVDVCDGRFVQSRSWPLEANAGEWERAVAQEEGLPLWERFEFEFDLMVGQPKVLALEAVEAGAARIILHLDAPGTPEAFEALRADGRAEVWLAGGVGLDLAPHLEAIGKADGFQQMGIRKIGFQGQEFDEASLDGVRTVRAAFPELPISVDGAVSADTAREIVEAGATKLVAGSAILRAENPREAAREIARVAAGE
jgi:ribulose-phosphate 3-epimerase